MLKLKLQYFGHLMRRTDSLEKTLMLGKTEGRRRRGWDGWMASPTWWTWVYASSRSWWRTGKPGVLQSMGSQRVGHNWVTELNWTGTLLTAMCQSGWEEDLRKSGYMHMYGWVPSLFTWNYHNIINWLYPNTK